MPSLSKSISLETIRHSLSHILAQAVLKMFPEAKLGIGPAIENGFYYDFELPRTLIPEDLLLIENHMREIIKENQIFKKKELLPDKSIDFLQNASQPYKVELAKDLKKESKKKISFYENIDREGNTRFIDMCAGPHIGTCGDLNPQAFKLTSIAGAYWKGNSSNTMMQRIYGIAFYDKKDLKKYLNMLEEAKKRDHREIGKRLDLFSFHDEGAGFPFWHNKGMIIKEELIKYWREIHRREGYKEISTPPILHERLWHQSGHFDHYKDNMYFTEIDEQVYCIKPMNCPGGLLVYKEKLHSYKEFPLRVGELGLVHRHELSGVLNGLFRVRHFTQDDAHIFCTPEQIEKEYENIMRLADEIYSKFGFSYHIELSTRPKKSIGSDEIWEKSEKLLKNILKKSGKKFKINEGDGAFYGPKIDYHLQDCIGRTWQCGTIQLDMSMPERFDLEYINKKGKRARPVMLHRVIYGSMERFIGILIEHFAGALPTWLSPIQLVFIPVALPHMDFIEKLKNDFKKFRIEIFPPEDSLGKRIRNAELLRIPFIAVIGDNEIKNNKLNIRSFKTKKQEEVKAEEFAEKLKKEVEERI